ncbi:MAG: DUF4363 family protein [Oscillospiraceae bacterium]|nr:DUF4363 family protein [Oscillospiraceae bacterium]MBQ9980957.1 DUF4363 family protein [Oscillospiraceae bacterium]
MSRVYISFAIIISIIIISISSLSMMKHEYERFDILITEIETHIGKDEFSEAIEKSELLSSQWISSAKKLSFFVNNTTLDEITDSSAKITPLIRSDSDEIIAETEFLKKRLKRIYSRDMPYVYNIF